MAGKVFFSVTMSVDGFIAPEERMDDADGPPAQWMELQQWIFPQRFFRENLKLGEGGEEGRDNDIARETFGFEGFALRVVLAYFRDLAVVQPVHMNLVFLDRDATGTAARDEVNRDGDAVTQDDELRRLDLKLREVLGEVSKHRAHAVMPAVNGGVELVRAIPPLHTRSEASQSL